ncbi:MAG: histidine--tRNA ligase, partial [Bacteroidia bacterium]|nr:histidine--tRNA ligase [Bacteroidia bacterium]
MVKRSYILDTIRGVFRLYGYLPIETTSIENLDTLLGKYGEEGDRLIFKILNSGDFLADVKNSDLNNISSKELAR